MPKSDDAVKALYEVELARLRTQLRDSRELLKHTQGRLAGVEDELRKLLGLQEVLVGVSPRVFQIKKSNRTKESVAVAVASDWHTGERVDPATVNGVNEYAPAIATARIERFFQNILVMVEMCRQRGPIKTLVLAILGDLMTNTLHEDLAESNYLSPTEEVIKVFALVCGGLDFLLEHGGFDEIVLPCLPGNHGRTTRKPRVGTANRNSYETMLYRLVATKYAGEKRLKFIIAEGYFVFLEVLDYKIRFHHGDWVKYQGGVGGLTIPLNKAIAQWNKMERADLDVIGHWHDRTSHKDFVVNGSVIGFNAFSISIKASYQRPQQSFFLVHPGRGKTVESPIFVD